MKRLITALAALGVLGAGALTIAGNAGAETKPAPAPAPAPSIIKTPIAAQMFKTCATVDAAKSQALGAGQIGVSATSTTTYGGPGCDAFVVDTTVTSASTPAGGYTAPFLYSHDPGGSIVGASNKAMCESYVLDVTYYKKAHGQTAFTKLGGGKMKGKWTQGNQFPCGLAQQPGWVNGPSTAFNLPGAGKTDTYRVAISFKEGGTKKVVKAGLSHVSEPPK